VNRASRGRVWRRGTAGLGAVVVVCEIEAAGDLAYERGSVAQTIQAGDEAPVTDRSRYLAVWRRHADGAWKCVRLVKY
jgi:ketosteroid isomerase-like protein